MSGRKMSYRVFFDPLSGFTRISTGGAGRVPWGLPPEQFTVVPPTCNSERVPLFQRWSGSGCGALKTVRFVRSRMKIVQNPRHWASKKALTTPGVRNVANYALVKMHTKIFLGKADENRREERRDHLDSFFDATMDTYVAALEAGYTEAEAREITHIQANFDFFNHGWTEMMEIPGEELEAHYRRYEAFFERHGITIDDPLGDFSPAGGVESAPTTLEKLETPEYENAIAGFADDVYVETADGETVVGGDTEEPEGVSPRKAPGVSEDDVEAE
jgi:hypothetical protein